MPSSDSDSGDDGAGPSWFSVMVGSAEEDAAGLPEAAPMKRVPALEQQQPQRKVHHPLSSELQASRHVSLVQTPAARYGTKYRNLVYGFLYH